MISENILTLNENLLLSKEMLSTRLIEKGVEASKSEGLFSLINKVSLIPTGAMLQEKTFETNGTFLPDDGFDGFNKVIISVPTSGADGTFWKLNENKYIINSEGEKMCAEELWYNSTNTGVSRPSNVPYSKEIQYDDYLYYNIYDMVGQTTLYSGWRYTVASGMTINGELMNTQSTYLPKEYGLYEVGFTNACYSDSYIYELSFSGNTRIKECVVNYNNNRSYLPERLYSGCTNLKKATILNLKDKNGKEQIPQYTFCGCSKLKDVKILNNITSIGNESFEGCSSLSSITIPDSVTSIGNLAFRNCTSLSGSFTFPTGVTTVGAFVLENTSISRVVINNVDSIGSYAFGGCSSLTRIDCYSPVAPTLGESCFKGLPNSGIVNVPIGSDYSTWKEVLPNWEFREVLV